MDAKIAIAKAEAFLATLPKGSERAALVRCDLSEARNALRRESLKTAIGSATRALSR